jgi:hypothetical protein
MTDTARNSATTYPHLHGADETLQTHENNENFQLYLQGRDLAYTTLATMLNEKLTPSNKATPGTLLWNLTEGQRDAYKEILEALEKLKG